MTKKNAINNFQKLVPSNLPVDKLDIFEEHFDNALGTFAIVKKLQKTEEEYNLFAEEYRDLHFSVRKKQKKIRKIEDKIKKTKSEIRNLDKDDASSKNKLELKIENYKLEIAELKNKIATSEEALKQLLIPKDPLDEKNVILEIRAGTGGDEAALFAGSLLRMYQRYCDEQNWKLEFLSISDSEKGGVKEAIIKISGKSVYSKLKYESGVHRVQRVPETESQGRVHTSAASVVVLPEAEDVDVQIDEKDIRVDVFRSSGAGGQHVKLQTVQ